MRNTETDMPEVYLDARSRRAKRAWDEAWSDPVKGRQNWQRVAFIQAGILLIAVFWLGYLGHQRKDVLYVVERDKARHVYYAGPVKPVDMDAKTWDETKIQALEIFLQSWRTVTTDRTAQDNDWDRAFLFVGDSSPAKAVLSKWFAENDPDKRASKGELVTIQFKTFDTEGAHTFGLWWDETTTALNGQIQNKKSYRARVVYEMHIPTSEEARAANPLGLLITELAVEEVQS